MRRSKMVALTEEIVDEAVRVADETQDPDYLPPTSGHWFSSDLRMPSATRSYS